MSKGFIFDVKRFSIHDGPGIRTTLFLKGCPLSCVWCQNPESISTKVQIVYHSSRCINCGACIEACQDGRLDSSECTLCGACTEACCSGAREGIGEIVSSEQMIDCILRDKVFYEQSGGGVTFSGGEPTAQIDFLESMLHLCREKGVNTAVDTCGFAPWESFARILDYTNLFLYDLKHLDSSIHERFTGVTNELILSNLIRLSESGSAITLRIPLVGGFNDNTDFFYRVTDFIGKLSGPVGVDVIECHTFAEGKYRMLGKEMCYSAPEMGKLDEFRQILRSAGIAEIKHE